MSNWHPACRDCALSGDCLIQQDNDVGICQDVREYEDD